MSLVFIASKGKIIQKLTKIVKMEEVKKIISPERPDEFQWNICEKCNLWWY